MRPKTYTILERAVEEGIQYGWNRAHKHTDKPEPEQMRYEIAAAVMLAIDEVFEFDTVADHDDTRGRSY